MFGNQNNKSCNIFSFKIIKANIFVGKWQHTYLSETKNILFSENQKRNNSQSNKKKINDNIGLL